jgi:hypothetical protein
MSIDKLLRDMVRNEVQRALEPMASVIARLQQQADIVARLADVFGAGAAKRSAGRPPKPRSALRPASGAKRGRPRVSRLCALEGCRRPSRSKGYCSAHYQKFRMLAKTNRLPPDWVENAPPGSVKNLALPRGRAGAKALAEAKKEKN